MASSDSSIHDSVIQRDALRQRVERLILRNEIHRRLPRVPVDRIQVLFKIGS